MQRVSALLEFNHVASSPVTKDIRLNEEESKIGPQVEKLSCLQKLSKNNFCSKHFQKNNLSRTGGDLYKLITVFEHH